MAWNEKHKPFLLFPHLRFPSSLYRFAPFFFYHQTPVTSTQNQKPSFFLFEWVVYHYSIGWQALRFPHVKSWTCGYLSTFLLVCNFFLIYLIWLLHFFSMGFSHFLYSIHMVKSNQYPQIYLLPLYCQCKCNCRLKNAQNIVYIYKKCTILYIFIWKCTML